MSDNGLFDTIKIFNNGSYERLIYSENKDIVYYKESIWKFENHRIVLYDFLKDIDNDYFVGKDNGNSFDKFLINVSLPYKNDSFYISNDKNLYYRKVDNVSK